MRDDSTLVMCCVRSAQGTHVLTEELHYRDGKWIRITVVNGHEEDVRPLSFPQARQFAIEHHLEQGAIREPIPELTFLLTFEFPLILQIERSDDPVEFDPSDWTLIGHLQDSAVNWSNDDELEIYDIFLFKSAEHWYCVTHTSIDSVVGEHARIVGAFLEKPKALRMLALNGFEMTKAFRSEELVQKLTPVRDGESERLKPIPEQMNKRVKSPPGPQRQTAKEREAAFDEAIAGYADSDWKRDSTLTNKAWRVRSNEQTGELFGEGSSERGWFQSKTGKRVIKKDNEGVWVYLTPSHSKKLKDFFSAFLT